MYDPKAAAQMKTDSGLDGALMLVRCRQRGVIISCGTIPTL